MLKAVNARDFDMVPRRLALWVKAGGRVLPGLVRRRAAEAALFASGDTPDDVPSLGTVEQIEGKPATKSTTNAAVIAGGAGGSGPFQGRSSRA